MIRFLVLLCFVTSFVFSGSYMELPLVDQRCEEFNTKNKYIYNENEKITEDIKSFLSQPEDLPRNDYVSLRNSLLTKYKDKKQLIYIGCVISSQGGIATYSHFISSFLPIINDKNQLEAKYNINLATSINNTPIILTYNDKAVPFDNYHIAISVVPSVAEWKSKKINTIDFKIEYLADGQINAREFRLKLNERERIDGKGVYTVTLISFNSKECKILLIKKAS